MKGFIDAHSHIHFKKDFPDVSEVISRAKEAGVIGQILIGCNVKDSSDAYEFVKTHKGNNFWCALGVHPHDSNQLNVQVLQNFERLIKEELEGDGRIVAIGEIGLDYNRNFQSEDIQKNAFREQLELAKKLDVPVIIHERDAWKDVTAILREAGNKKVVIHSFTGGYKEAMHCLEMGYYISFSGMLTYPKNEEIREAANVVPDDKFFIETDCPYLPPQPYRGQRNEPAYVVEVAKELARIWNVSTDEVGERTIRNAETLFGVKLVV